MVYEIINPSDPYTLESDDPQAAYLACLLLGEGNYTLRDRDGKRLCPAFLFSPDDAIEQDYRQRFGCEFPDAVKTYLPEPVASVLETVLIGGFSARADYADAVSRMQPREASDYRKVRHERLRTSLNDIGQRAQDLAASLRATHAEKQEAA